MKFLPDLLCLCLLCLFGKTFCDEEGSVVIYVDEGRHVTLPCSLGTKKNIESNLFDWKKDDQMVVFTYDGGFDYNNNHWRQSEQFKVASPKPYVTIQSTVTTMRSQIEDGVLLQCEVRGASPEPRVEWQDSAGNILPAEEPLVSERGGSYHITLQTTVTKTDRYRCVVTQEEINRVTDGLTYVPVCGKIPP
ncbi:hypothetical protein EPR50_G00034720 [Perca flavescens]|uniref:Ig-like domain-containing protein n=1 Tax=Perca flavescens TaxID=8167 RepID=A0A484DGH2_PERFV|nr:hypothetical protein EPR50_G00034720 [Perca flavescens]